MTAASPEITGRVVRTLKNGLPILWTFVPEMPSTDAQLASPWLTIVQWKYDGSDGNGMPNNQENERMLSLEVALGKVERQDFCFEAYRRVGCGLREYVFYVADQEGFLEEFNEHVADQPRYPIEITFYKDETWSELRELIDDLGDA
jgi:hypothetical protein